MNIPDLKRALYEGIVLFEFVKRDGTLRHARGTTCPDLVPTDDTPKGRRTPEQQALYDRQTVAFYDIDKKGWRSMRIDTIWSYQRAMKLT
ncbi:MAG: DUF2693 domain-containing protein [Paludibacteraceae bacterium]|nr:DUF2693 domain-containing protein [Paludibacteraceae bacterium]